MEFQIARGEIFLRVIAIFLLVLTACLIAFDTQTKVVFLTMEKKVTYKDVDALRILLYVSSSAAGYNLLQLCKHSCPSMGSYDMSMVWISLLFDQIAVYLTFATNSALFQAALFALSGSDAFQWLKVCNKFTRFCEQIAGAILCCVVASILMAMISIISAYKVFRMYSPKRFLRLKGK